MAVIISGIEEGSAAAGLGIRAGQALVSIDGHFIEDGLDYRFYLNSSAITVEILDGDVTRIYNIRKKESDDIGLIFDSWLIDSEKRCKNKCVFCFIDQLPKDMRKSLYFKDDDTRLSFLFGNYVTLTNLTEKDIARIIKMRISPVNISVHTTDPELRVKIMGNPNAGKVLAWLPRLAQNGIRINAQLVLCPGLNDGEALKRSLGDLLGLGPMMQSVAIVPVGLTDHRNGLYPLRVFTKEEAGEVIEIVESIGAEALKERSERTAYASDEFYLIAGKKIPAAGFYGAFDQLENGVGLWSLLEDEFEDALKSSQPWDISRKVIIATGIAARPLIKKLSLKATEKFPGLKIEVKAINNNFFGDKITVAGLVTGGDLIAQLKGKLTGDALLIPAVMLRRERDLFLDGITPGEIEAKLGINITLVENNGEALLSAMLGNI